MSDGDRARAQGQTTVGADQTPPEQVNRWTQPAFGPVVIE
jgi:hypothetical protein